MRSFFGLDTDYVRPLPPRWWVGDITVALLLTVLTCIGLWAFDVVGFTPVVPLELNLVPALGWALTGGVLIVFRRRFPVVTMALVTGALFVLTGYLEPAVAAFPTMQLMFFLGLYSAMAWARHRGWLLVGVSVVMLAMALWVGVEAGRQVDTVLRESGVTGTAAFLLFNLTINLGFFGAAIWLGGKAWWAARDHDEIVASRALIEQQADDLAAAAVVAERLRIARDLHDSVAHHISLIGVQAAAARRAMEKRPDAAAEALREVEGSARDAVGELRSMLGTLRAGGDDPLPDRHTLDALATLVDQNRSLGLEVETTVTGAGLEDLPITASRTLYRVTQEALTNVRRHSTAQRARVAVRVNPESAEVEITDDGLPRRDSTGSGLGLIGIRERVELLGGTSDIGPRPERGYRVLTRIPLAQGDDA